jgi:hypothetical protein
MKKLKLTPLALLLAFSCLGLSSGIAQDAEGSEEADRIKYHLILPDEKNPENVKPIEPNPFNKQSSADEDDSSSEENAVREALASLPVSGLSNDPRGGKRIMMGPFRLERGMIVPPLLPQQAVALRVNSISDTVIEFVWIEKKNTSLTPRTLTLPFTTRPTVRQLRVLPTMAAPSNGTSDRYILHAPPPSSMAAPAASSAPPQPMPEATSANIVTPAGTPAVSSAEAPPAAKPQDPADPTHPANMLMQLFMNKAQPTGQTTPKE